MPVTPSVRSVDVVRVRGRDQTADRDTLAVEEPLEIRLAFDAFDGQRTEKSISITMRTPGADRALAIGFLVSEGIVRRADDLAIDQPSVGESNIVRVALRAGVRVELSRLERHFYTTSSCGVCGKSSLESLAVAAGPVSDGDDFFIAADMISALPDRLRAAQKAFALTGGLHATGLFDQNGTLVSLHEDVGRHNAFDKVVGDALLAGLLPFSKHIVLVSGRASFELVQKAVMAGVRILAAVGAPSSLAVELAHERGITLAGFVRDGRCNIYSHAHRVSTERP